MITAVTIWRRLAPSVRSIANSRVRWATVIENVLKIRNEATKSDTPAKTSSAVCRKPTNSPTSSFWDSVFSVPVSTWMVLGSSDSRVAASRSGEVPSSAATTIWSNLPSLPVIRCASGRVKTAAVAPPKVSALPSVAVPTSV